MTANITAASPSTAVVSGGTVSFYDGSIAPANLLATSSTVANGTASANTSALSVSLGHTILAVYTGNAGFGGSTGTLTSYAVSAATTTTAVAANPASGDLFGESVTLTATVTTASPSSAPVNGGTVKFYDGAAIPANLLGTSTAVVNGSASITTGALSVNPSHTITAVYSGDGLDFNGSTGTLPNYSVVAVGTHTAVAASPATGDAFGVSVTLTANITSLSPGAATVAGGTVSFYDGSAIPANLIGTSGHAVVGGTASISTSALAVSSGHTITAVYSGDGLDFAGSTGTLTNYAVGAASTSTAVSETPASGDIFGQNVALTATVTATGGSTAVVSGGTVSFYDGAAIPANLLGTSATVAAGTASINTTLLALGAQTITAVYSGATNFVTSTGMQNNYGVGQADTSTTVASSSIGNTSGFGQAVTFAATVVASSPSTVAVSGGTVGFYDGAVIPANLIGTSAAVANGTATLTISTLAQGNHVITAVYNSADTGAFTTSTSPTIDQNVLAVTTTSITSSTANPTQYAQSISYAITVAGNSTSGAPTGTVTLYDGAVAPANQIGSPISLSASGNNAIASGTLTTLTVGSHTITAVYNGQANVYAPSSGTLEPAGQRRCHHDQPDCGADEHVHGPRLRAAGDIDRDRHCRQRPRADDWHCHLHGRRHADRRPRHLERHQRRRHPHQLAQRRFAHPHRRLQRQLDRRHEHRHRLGLCRPSGRHQHRAGLVRAGHVRLRSIGHLHRHRLCHRRQHRESDHRQRRLQGRNHDARDRRPGRQQRGRLHHHRPGRQRDNRPLDHRLLRRQR